MNSAIAQKLNVLESAIVRVEVWANVLFVVVKGLGARFVSKKIVEKKVMKPALESVGNRWAKNGMDRLYFEPSFIAKMMDISNSQARKINSEKFYFDFEDSKFYTNSSNSHVRGWASVLKDSYMVPSSASSEKPFANAMLTSTGQWVTPEQWDEIEGAM